MKPSDLDFDAVYDLFTRSYLDATGNAQPREWFERHFRKWEFFGTDRGMVAIRRQRCGLIKLTGAAGNRSGVLRGIKEVLAMEKPTWSAVSKDLMVQTHRLGFITPPAWVIVAVMTAVGDRISKGRTISVNRNGSFNIEFANIGVVEKYFIANRLYYAWLVKEAPTMFALEWGAMPRPARLALETWARRG